jgi:GNAT superfamily N-acetyltransferase
MKQHANQDEITWHQLTRIPTAQREPYISAFARINQTWIKHYFVLEPKDVKTLNDPQTSVLDGGGEVLFGCIDNQVAVTCAIIKQSDAVLELSKMGVDAAFKGRGLGKLIVPQAVRLATEMGASLLFLESNRRLHSALSIYEQCGFKEAPMQDTPYARADIRMEIEL